MSKTGDAVTITRKGISANGNPYEISFGVKSVVVDGVELFDDEIRSLLEPIVDNVARAIELGTTETPAPNTPEYEAALLRDATEGRR